MTTHHGYPNPLRRYVEEGDPAVDAQVEGVGAAIAGTDGVGTSETDGPTPDPVSGENVETKKDQ